ncbi:hypothetical protein TorRG33x02_071660 [Trema orientale]|uniref:Uncharacterized protein n=1 Tax=Trema orientale TaxID=63057 RepID=A0A2P5FH70_TREOI|nr:hypothetical protein TorRG33x02_071660 [Trema orientale]
MFLPLYHPHKLAELTRSQRPPTKLTSVHPLPPDASTSATSSSGYAYISGSNYKISADTSISCRVHLPFSSSGY